MTHRIVIVGGGAGGLELATGLGRRLGKRGRARITLVDTQLTHVWKPLLHEVAAGSLNASENELNYVAQAKWNHFEFQIGRLCALDRAARTIELAATLDADGQELVPARALDYDTLVIAVGSTINDFGTPGAAERCFFLDSAAQAQRFHQQMLSHYLRAHASRSPLHSIDVVIVGAGATGVELAAELHNAAQELAAYGLDSIRPQDMHITLVEAGPRVLPALPERIGRAVHTALERIGVRVRTDARVEAVTDAGLQISGGELIPAALKIWAAGIRAPVFLSSLDGLETNRIHQLKVRPTLQTTGDDNIFALGDCAECPLGDGSDRHVPPRAQAAHQQASMLVCSMPARLAGKPLPAYRYRDYGSLVSLSHHTAIGNLMGRLLGSVKIEGWLARMFYVSLYRMHQVALYGFFRTGMLMLSDRIGRSTQPRLKLH
jgi:NADH:ubiquinone reductase (H+-translocating)